MSRYVDAEILKERLIKNITLTNAIDRSFNEAPSIDIVRCAECKHYDKFSTWSACTYWSGDPYEQASVNADDFCSYGQKGDENVETD